MRPLGSLIAVLAVACAPPAEPRDAGTDASTLDASEEDAARLDATDAARRDAGADGGGDAPDRDAFDLDAARDARATCAPRCDTHLDCESSCPSSTTGVFCCPMSHECFEVAAPLCP